MAGVWALLIGTGLGSTALVALGALCFVVGGRATPLGGGAGRFAAARAWRSPRWA